ncbi:hypothetical protein [Gorillibacterium sp. sgz5001074]|uniref:hypothetical protein n=1 Tax=Gorillibacterium sp. sgz5001074 TaxID=3446695 RepID=UPI003F67CBDE
MTIFGIILAIIVTIGLTMMMGPYGGMLILAVLFGMVFSTHLRTREMQKDLLLIKEKLGIQDPEELEVYPDPEETLAEGNEEDKRKLLAMNEEIERELEVDLDAQRRAGEGVDDAPAGRAEHDQADGTKKGND